MKTKKHFSPNLGLLFISGSILLSASAQLLLKLGMLELHKLYDISPFFPALIWVSIGLACYALSMLFWMAALSKYELSFAYPMLSISYILVYICAALMPQLHESVSFWKTIGILFIVVGVILVTKTKKIGYMSEIKQFSQE